MIFSGGSLAENVLVAVGAAPLLLIPTPSYHGRSISYPVAQVRQHQPAPRSRGTAAIKSRSSLWHFDAFVIVVVSLPQCAWPAMADIRLSIRLDLTDSDSIGPGKIALLEAIRVHGSISAAARYLGMSYRRAWLLVEQINKGLSQPAVTAATGGASGGGAALTQVGEQIIELYRAIESRTRSSASSEFRALGKLIRHRQKARI